MYFSLIQTCRSIVKRGRPLGRPLGGHWGGHWEATGRPLQPIEHMWISSHTCVRTFSYTHVLMKSLSASAAWICEAQSASTRWFQDAYIRTSASLERFELGKKLWSYGRNTRLSVFTNHTSQNLTWGGSVVCIPCSPRCPSLQCR